MASKPSRLEMLSFAKYVSSFIPGRVRVRHPALKNAQMTQASRERLMAIAGLKNVEFNLQTGSALITYDAKALTQDDLIGHGIDWIRWIEAQAKA